MLQDLQALPSSGIFHIKVCDIQTKKLIRCPTLKWFSFIRLFGFVKMTSTVSVVWSACVSSQTWDIARCFMSKVSTLNWPKVTDYTIISDVYDKYLV